MYRLTPFPLRLCAVAVAAATAGCALVMDVDFGGYHEGSPTGPDAGGTGGTAGGGGASGTGGTGGTDAPDATTCEPRLVINEIQTAGPGGVDDEFVELYNAGTCPADLTGVQLAYRSSSATVDHGITWDADNGVIVPAGGTYVVAGATFPLTPDGRFPAGFALSASGGGLAVRAGGEVLDQAGWGDATNDFVNQLAAVAPASGMSIARRPDGADTNSDMNDLTEGTPTPSAPNGLP